MYICCVYNDQISEENIINPVYIDDEKLYEFCKKILISKNLIGYYQLKFIYDEIEEPLYFGTTKLRYIDSLKQHNIKIDKFIEEKYFDKYNNGFYNCQKENSVILETKLGEKYEYKSVDKLFGYFLMKDKIILVYDEYFIIKNIDDSLVLRENIGKIKHFTYSGEFISFISERIVYVINVSTKEIVNMYSHYKDIDTKLYLTTTGTFFFYEDGRVYSDFSFTEIEGEFLEIDYLFRAISRTSRKNIAYDLINNIKIEYSDNENYLLDAKYKFIKNRILIAKERSVEDYFPLQEKSVININCKYDIDEFYEHKEMIVCIHKKQSLISFINPDREVEFEYSVNFEEYTIMYFDEDNFVLSGSGKIKTFSFQLSGKISFRIPDEMYPIY